jgi:acyl-CoA synthetase (AMP-forming)/AMP-acid ligase II
LTIDNGAQKNEQSGSSAAATVRSKWIIPSERARGGSKAYNSNMMEYLSDVLNGGVSQTPDEPCFVIRSNCELEDGDGGGGEEERKHDPTAILRCLSYRHAQEALLQHQCWLAAQAERKFPLEKAAAATDASASFSTTKNRIVVAYLATNSIDYILSVMACSSPRKQDQQYHDHVRHARRRLLLPALLNTRWTASEAAAALMSSGNKNKGKKRTSDLLLLYGPGFESMATEIITRLNSNSTETTTSNTKSCCCLPIPAFAVQKIQQQQRTINDAATSSRCATGIVKSRPNRPVIVDAEQEIQRLAESYNKPRPLSSRRATNDSKDEDDDTAVIVFTSGTTSLAAKGVKLGHLAILIQSLAKLTLPCLYSADTVLLASPSAVPFFHVGGLTSFLAVWLAGGTLLQIVQNDDSKQSPHGITTATNANGAFDPVVVLQSLQPAWMASPSFTSSSFSSCFYYCNTLVLVPAMLQALQQQQLTLSSNDQQIIYPFVKLVLIGGQSASSSQLNFARLSFPNARLVQTYACTEAASSITFCNVTSKAPAAAAGNYLVSGDCVGQPPSHIQVALLRMPLSSQQHDQRGSSTTNQQLMIQQPKITSNMMIYQPSQVGVIATRGPHVMHGYWKDNSDNINSDDCKDDNINFDGWFITNDLGFWGSESKNDNAQLDLYFCGRTTDTIRTGGETVMALEVERILLQHPSIDQVAVFDVPDEQYGQAVAGAIVLANNDVNNNKNQHHQHQPVLQLDHLRQWCKQQGLAGYKCPRQVFYMTQLPRNSSGKVLKTHLRERFGHVSSVRVVTSKL